MQFAKTNYRKFLKTLVVILSLAPLVWLLFSILSDTFLGTKIMTANPVQKLDRELGDWGLIFIILSLSIRPSAEILNFPGLIVYRRMLGLFAFFYVCLHVLSYVTLNLQLNFDALLQDIIKRNFITVGIVAFIFMIPLAVTSTKTMIKWIGGRRWQLLHFLIYPIVLMAVWHFFMMVRADFSRPIVYLTIIMVLLCYRFWSRFRKINKNS